MPPPPDNGDEFAPCARCRICGGPAHAASGCQYGVDWLVCGPCVRDAWLWIRQHVNGKGARKGVYFYDHVRGPRT